ncbi:MAG: hypothetical protein M1838_003099 [Thelocarpon superellum]|nr:MAG: hypothetical protein M1838_003099 [Thelocarpon superellum]
MYFRRRRPKSNFSVLRRGREQHDGLRTEPALVRSPSSVVGEMEGARSSKRQSVQASSRRRGQDVAGTTTHLLPLTDAEEFDQRLFEAEVLCLRNGLTELTMDDTYLREAAEVGCAWPSSPTPKTASADALLSASESSDTLATEHLPSGSTSRASHSTGITSRLSTDQGADEVTKSPASGSVKAASTSGPVQPQIRKSLSFTDYERFLAQAQAQALSKKPRRGASRPPTVAVGLRSPPPDPDAADTAPSVFSTSSRRSRHSLRRRLRRFSAFRTSKMVVDEIRSCVCCRDDFQRSKALHHLPCSHSYCDACLRVLVTQAMQDESKMPPRCCKKAVPGAVVKTLLDAEEQQQFMKRVLQYGTPWEHRMFCPNAGCGDFIPTQTIHDPQHPLDVICTSCDTVACKQCRREAHVTGEDCPADWELDAVLQMGENQGWRRCYKCRTLVELTAGCSHMTCRCKAQFCYICGSVWDADVGCPNFCAGEEELERRRATAEERRAREEGEAAGREAAAARRATETREAAARSAVSTELQQLRALQEEEMDRFLGFEQKQNWLMWTRHGKEKLEALDARTALERAMKEKVSALEMPSCVRTALTGVQHIDTANMLEDRQVAAEMELREALVQEHKSCTVRLRHMEAYCDRVNTRGLFPDRVITDRDLRELGQQYNLRNDMDRLHQSRINVLRDKQAQQLETLGKRQDEHLQQTRRTFTAELRALEERIAREEKGFTVVFGQRKERLSKRWAGAAEILRKKLEERDGVAYGPLPRLEWLFPGASSSASTPPPVMSKTTSWVLI